MICLRPDGTSNPEPRKWGFDEDMRIYYTVIHLDGLHSHSHSANYMGNSESCERAVTAAVTVRFRLCRFLLSDLILFHRLSISSD